MNRFKGILFIIVTALPWTAFGQGLQGAKSSAEADLRDALQRYEQLQERIKTEKIPLNERLNELSSQLREKRREAERSRRLRDNRSVDLNALRERVASRDEQISYISNLITDFGERFQRDLDLSEQQIYSAALERFRASVNQVVPDEANAKAIKLMDQIFMVPTAIERFDALVGGRIFSGKAVVEGGQVIDGDFLAMGPAYYFAAADGSFGGHALRSTTSELPPTAAISEQAGAQIKSTIDDRGGVLPVDPSLGSALAIMAEEDTLWEHIQKGGTWIWPILFFAFLAFVTSVFKIFEIYTVKMPKPGTVHDILLALNDGDREKALELARKVPGPTRAMLVDAVEHSDESKELIEEVMYERMLEVQPRLERMLPFIAVTAATAPLMGLLGTVTGMINTFKLITIFGTGDAKQLSSGISEALVTTEFGLIVAIPSLIMHALLNRRAQGVLASMERMAVAFVNGLVRKN